MRAWITRLSGEEMLSLLNYKKAKAGTVCKRIFQLDRMYIFLKDCTLSNIRFKEWFLCSSDSYLSSLECLDLSNNNLSTVPKGLPRSLVLLHLEKNIIHSIPGDALTSVRNLEYLLLHNNKLRSRSIHPAAFQVHKFLLIYFFILIAHLKHFQRIIDVYSSPESNVFTRA